MLGEAMVDKYKEAKKGLISSSDIVSVSLVSCVLYSTPFASFPSFIFLSLVWQKE